MKKVKVLSLVMMLVLALGVFVGCGGDNDSKAEGKAGVKIVLTDKDKKDYTYDIDVTDGTTLREALYEAKLIDEKDHGAMFVETIDGHTANVEKDGCTWLVTDKDGEQIDGSFDEITVSDGQEIHLVYYQVPDMD